MNEWIIRGTRDYSGVRGASLGYEGLVRYPGARGYAGYMGVVRARMCFIHYESLTPLL